MLWSAAVMSNLYHSSPIKVPCSAYSMSVQLAHGVGYWDTDSHSIGEDMHMYLKCFFATQGHLKVTTIYSPASQCNVQGNGYVAGMVDRYGQAKRHMWGSLDSGYMFRRILFGILTPGYDSPTNGLVEEVPLIRPPAFENDTTSSGLIKRIPVLLHRMTEAHIVMGQVLALVAIAAITRPETSGHPYVLLVTSLGGTLRAIFGVAFIVMLFFYEKYHQYVSVDRWALSMQEQLHAGSGEGVMPLGKRSQLSSPRTWTSAFDWVWLPVAGMLYLTLPQLHAHVLHLWTDKLDYTVAPKPPIAAPVSHFWKLENVIVQSRSNGSLSTEEDSGSVQSRGDSGFFEFEGGKGPLTPGMWAQRTRDEGEVSH
jgi:Glycosyl transferase family group 2